MSSLPPRLLTEIRAGLSRHTRVDANPQLVAAPAGGQINHSAVLKYADHRYFLKLNKPERLPMFEAEQAGLKELADAQCLRVPVPVLCGSGGGHSYLVIEHLELQGRGDCTGLGSGLAALHAVAGEHFGWKMDNTIGLTPQINTPSTDWPGFWREHRLGFQLGLAVQNGHAPELEEMGQRLMAGMHRLFDSYSPIPSLLHGDLWAGNFGYLPGGEPVIYDPAVYYGDRETDLAMTELFGGFDPEFYSAYHAAWALDPGYSTRKHLYKLYHVLNHLNLFGAAYLGQAVSLTGRLLAELG